MSEPSSGILGSLGINGLFFLAQLINFGLVVFVVWRWIYRPLLKIMDERAKKIAGGLNDAELAKRHLAESEVERKKILDATRKESDGLIDEARQSAEQEKTRIMKEAQMSLDQQLDDARVRLRQEKEAIVGAVKYEMAELVTLAAEKVAGEGLDPAAHRTLIKKAIEGLDETEV